MRRPDAVVLDVEGTTSPIAAVKETLYSYAAENLGAWLAEGSETALAVRSEVGLARGGGGGAASVAETERTLLDWLAQDTKASALKLAQGAVCHDGFERGHLVGVFYPDVRLALQSWSDAGTAVHTYSSGSVQNQIDWFEHAEGGSLLSFLDGHFDLLSAGPKTSATSYERITEVIGHRPERTVFLSDVTAELEAARAAGWTGVLVARPDNPDAGDGSAEGFVTVSSMLELVDAGAAMAGEGA